MPVIEQSYRPTGEIPTIVRCAACGKTWQVWRIPATIHHACQGWWPRAR